MSSVYKGRPPKQDLVRTILRPKAELAHQPPAGAEAILQALHAVPAPVLRAMQKRGFKLMVVDEMSEVWPDLVGEVPGHDGLHWEDMTGAHRGGVAVMAVQGIAGPEDWRRITLHETGHALDFYCGDISQSSWFEQAWAKAVATASIPAWAVARRMPGAYFCQSDGRGQLEWFAELSARAWMDVDERHTIERTWPGLLAKMSEEASRGLQIAE